MAYYKKASDIEELFHGLTVQKSNSHAFPEMDDCIVGRVRLHKMESETPKNEVESIL